MCKNLLLLTIVILSCSFSMLYGQAEMTVEERNERIRQRWNRSLVNNPDYKFNKEANELLVQTISGIPQGKALCIAMGQGRNALYLARNGWDVTGFDLADEAIAFADKRAEAEGIKVETHVISADDFDYGSNQYDLITHIYAGCLYFDDITNKIHEALKPGGLLVFEFFHREAGIGMDRPNFGCEANAILKKVLDQGGFEIVLYEEKEGRADYGLDQNKLVYMVASKK